MRPERRVILLGASVRAAAESATRAGFAVTGLDHFGDADTQCVCECYYSLAAGRQSAELAGELPPAAVVVVGGLGGADDLLRSLAQRHPVFGSPRRQPASQHQLSQLQRIAERSGVRVPPTFPAGQPRSTSGGQRWLEKETGSAGGLGVRWAGAADSAEPTSPAARPWRQQWVAGRAFGAVFLGVAGSAVLLGVCRSSFTRRSGRPFTYAGSFGPVPCSDQLVAKLVRFASGYAARYAVTGLFNVDLILDREGRIWILEINRRWSASCEVVEQALVRAGRLKPPQTLFGWHWQAITGAGPLADPLQEAIHQGWALKAADGEPPQVWKRVVDCRWSGRFDPERLERIRTGRAEAAIRFADLPQPAARVRRGEPLLTLIGWSDAGSPTAWRSKRALIAAAQQAVVPDC